MQETEDIERCGLADGDLLCVLKKEHDGAHCLREVPVFHGEPLLNAFCPHCGSRPMLEGPGCKECDGEEEVA